MELWVTLFGFFLAPISGVVSYFAGLRKSKNDFLHEMQKSINLLTSENTKLVERVVDLNTQMIALRKENELLKGNIEKMSNKLEYLKKDR